MTDIGVRADQAPPVRRHRFTGTDPDEAHERLRTFYGPMSVRLLDDPAAFAFALDVLATDDLHIGSLRYSGRAVAELSAARPLLVLQAHQGGRLSLDLDGEAVGASPLLAPREKGYRARWQGLDATAVALDPATVARVGAEMTGMDPEQVEFTAATAVSSDRARYWAACTNHVRREVLEQDALVAQPLVRDHAVRHLALALLATFPNTTHAFEAPSRRVEAAPATVRRAVAFIDAHAHEPIGLVEIAAAARLGPRGLQQAFAHHHDTTPLAHLRRIRLERAHRDLRAGDPTGGDTVAAIAARWGFAHPGRFSLTYREHFGVSPSNTLRG